MVSCFDASLNGWTTWEDFEIGNSLVRAFEETFKNYRFNIRRRIIIFELAKYFDAIDSRLKSLSKKRKTFLSFHPAYVTRNTCLKSVKNGSLDPSRSPFISNGTTRFSAGTSVRNPSSLKITGNRRNRPHSHRGLDTLRICTGAVDG